MWATVVPGGGPGEQRIVIAVGQLTGAPGSLTLSTSFTVDWTTQNVSCQPSGCSLSGQTRPRVAIAVVETAEGPVTISLLDGSGQVVQTVLVGG